MNKKLFTQLYNERRSNVWLLIELLLVSVVLWFTVDTLFVTLTTYTAPKGFDLTNTYKLDLEYINEKSADYIPNRTPEALQADVKELVNRLRRHPQVEAVSLSSHASPYSWSENGSSAQLDTLKSIEGLWKQVSPDFFRVFRYRGVNGETPEQLADLFKKGTMMASRNLFQPKHDVDLKDFVNRSFILFSDTTKYYPLVAALETVRRNDFEQACNSRTVVSYLSENEPFSALTSELCIRVRDGVPSTFAEDFMKELSANYQVGSILITKLTPFEAIRQNYLVDEMKELQSYLVGAGFLLLNIFLGLLGTFWFRTQQRRSEIALMMALGASKRAMFTRLMSEGMLLLAVVTPLAMVIDFNIAYAELTPSWYLTSYSVGRFFICTFSTFALIALMIFLGIWFPARKAMRIQLAETLHED